MKKMYVVYALLTIGLAVAGVLVSQGDLMIMVDSPSLALLLVPTIFMLLSHYGPKEFIRAFQVAMAKTSAGEKELKNALLFFHRSGNDDCINHSSGISRDYHDPGFDRKGTTSERQDRCLVDGGRLCVNSLPRFWPAPDHGAL